MQILGVDPGLKITGYGLIEEDKGNFNIITAGVIHTSAKQALTERLAKIYSGLWALVEDRRPDVLVLEKLYVHWRHPTTAYLLGQARGIVCLICALKNIELQEYAVTRINKAIVGCGNASKNQIQRMMQSVLNLKKPPQPQDVADALALAVAHAYISHSRKVLSRRSYDCQNMR